ncbi:YeeE/YedE thiosulfate transporter family protein [Corynebacterium sanguinis]|uniref:YeeE/YedE family protein n=2 Tax=Corynebacterium TaxID=1716 RepID=A0A6C1TV11_9CORY|nr:MULTISPECIES: YeeE/YedE thiosulfate transporter family protein [Corynebacterium]MBA4505848.1 YeeE/YedE family protein [Corynebacterium sanguinis]MCT1411806.1 YeeE/YedE family protein [Corynebacterium sanguinis]MCT1413743.1 YeeE/YedE family protein [Corynebacterium sanguinis]MCT1426637.1 YeeE/YedE family protein [Corynebacterium sanguinis]MCT1444334.1 YeeE/YedE family protein [Corynebacterium sanguinis]
MLASGLVVGAALGAIMQRGRFCVTGMLRDVFLQKKGRGLVALFIVIAVHAVGLAALTTLGVIAPDYRTFQPVAVITGGFLFGISIVLAGGCASGTWYRSAEGLVGSWFALVFYALSAAAMKNGMLSGFEAWMKQWDTGWTTLPQTFGVSPWFFAIPLALATAWAAHYYLAKDAARPKVTLQQPWYKKALHPYTAGTLIGILGVIAWPLSAATGRNDGLGITTPSAHAVSFITTGEEKFLNWGTLLVIGLFIGAFIAAKASGEFRVRVPDATTTVRAIVGGIGMGVGAALAGGCTVGNGMVQTSLFSYQGWVALGFIALGVFVGSKIWLKPSVAAPQGTYSTEDSIRSAEDAVIESTPQGGGFQVATGLITVPTTQKRATKARPIGPGRYKLDTLGAVCPFPLIEAKDAIAELDDGEKLVIDFDCTQATESIPQWAADNGHGIEDFAQNRDAGWEITVVKNAAR